MTYFIKRKILRWFFKIRKKSPDKMPMIQYWKMKEAVLAKVTKDKDGALIMVMDGEKEYYPGFPRSHLLFGPLSKLKHEIKNQIFNDSWRLLEEGKPKDEVIGYIKDILPGLEEYLELSKYDIVPPEKMISAVREIWRAFSKVEKEYSGNTKEKIRLIKEMMTYVMQEDDSYRFRLQWIVQIFNPSSWWFKLFFRNPVKDFEIALQELEHAEIIDDMKAKIRLLRRILLLLLEDKKIKEAFNKLCKEMNWNKLKLSEADKFHFRGKWFKCDFDKFEY